MEAALNVRLYFLVSDVEGLRLADVMVLVDGGGFGESGQRVSERFGKNIKVVTQLKVRKSEI